MKALAPLLFASLLSTGLRAGSFSTGPWTDDASSGIVSGTSWAYHFGSATPATVNGVTVGGIAGSTAGNAHFDLTGPDSVFNDDVNLIVSGGSEIIANDYIHGGNPTTVTVKGLTPGNAYTVSFLSVGWQADPGATYRTLAFSSGDDNAVVQQGQFGSDQGIRIDYTFTADAVTRVITAAAANPASATFHLYGLSLRPGFTVTSTGDSGAGSLREAIAAAAAVPGADTIAFAAALGGQTITLASELVIGDAGGVTIDAGAVPGGVTLSGNQATRIAYLAAGAKATLEDLALTGGNGSGAQRNGLGGAICIESTGKLDLKQCQLTGNQSSSGGAVFSLGTMNSAGCSFSGNHASIGGALQAAEGVQTLSHCTFSGNSSQSGGGGAIQNVYASTTLTDCVLSGNSALGAGPFGGGGAIYASDGNLALTRCILLNNSAPGHLGGAIRSDSWLSLAQCTLAGNSAKSGGAIYSFSVFTVASVTQCTITGNSAAEGGGYLNFRGPTIFTHCTISGNTATTPGRAGGVDSYTMSGTSDPTETVVRNSIIAGNSGGDVSFTNSVSNTFTSEGGNIIGNGNAAGAFNAAGDTTGVSDPLLAPLDNHGGPTPTRALLPGSPARNAGVILSPAITSDQRGYPMVGAPDSGAYEAGTFDRFATWSVESTGSLLSFDGDLENDGTANGLEYALRRDPGLGDPQLSPVLSAAGVAGSTFQFRYQKDARDLRYIVQRGENPGSWTEIYRFDTSTGQITENGVAATEDAGTGRITVTDPATGPRNFWRLVVEPVP
jgi:predicted outer membrane repeat protein